MKTILVDAVDAFVIGGENSFSIFEPMREMLDEFPNTKILLTGADDEQFQKFGLDKMPYEVFTLKHNPEKPILSITKKCLNISISHRKGSCISSTTQKPYGAHNLSALRLITMIVRTRIWELSRIFLLRMYRISNHPFSLYSDVALGSVPCIPRFGVYGILDFLNGNNV